MSPLPPLPSPLLPTTAVEWRVGPGGGFQEVRIVTRLQRDGSTLYAVTREEWTANRGGEWEEEPIPSSRDDAYISRCRWADFEDAHDMAQRMVGVA